MAVVTGAARGNGEAAARLLAARGARVVLTDVLVNNAGIMRTGSIESLSEDDYMEVVRVNQLGCFLGMQSAIPTLTAAAPGSAIVNISSVAGLKGVAGCTAYVATKFAVRGMTPRRRRSSARSGSG